MPAWTEDKRIFRALCGVDVRRGQFTTSVKRSSCSACKDKYYAIQRRIRDGT
jgi:hypothetical protein